MEHKCKKSDSKPIEKCELNKEQIIKALETLIGGFSKCANEIHIDACGLFCKARHIVISDLTNRENNECNENCKHYAPPYIRGVVKDALALIKELTEEVVDLKAIAEGYQKQFEDCYAENERLHASCTELEQVCKKWQGRLNIECEYTRADTVRKMHSEIKARCIEGGIYPAFVERVIDQIAKEMLEGTTPTNNANTCICCGAIIPEGVLACPKCDKGRSDR